MTPKQEAKYIVNEYSKILVPWEDNYEAKQCSLIAVNKILNNVMLYWYSPTKDMPKDLVYFVTQRKYWEDVKTEIEKL